MNSPDPGHWQLPGSAIFTVKDTDDTGRAVFANDTVKNGCHVLNTTAAHSPTAYVIQRPYRREVCSWCFLYDRGREWKLRNNQAGTAFCSPECHETWSVAHDSLGHQALQSVETFIKAQSKRGNRPPSPDGEHEVADHASEPAHVWRDVEVQGREIVQARKSKKLSKLQRARLRKTSELSLDADILTYVLSGVLSAYAAYKSRTAAVLDGRVESTDAATLLPALFELAADNHVFITSPMTPSPLHDYTAAYLVLLTLIPVELLDVVTSELVINLASRASHNAFSIRPEGTTDGEQSGEFLGWGVWPEASFFNHSCRPNIRKQRSGRYWSFEVRAENDAPVQKGQQLCITYLGGDEKDLDVTERRERLQEQWGFLCLCERCQQESAAE